MSDLAKTQAQFNHFMEEELCFFLSSARILREVRDTFGLEREQCVILDGRDYVTGAVINGVDYGVNTTLAGILYVRLTTNGSNFDVHIYLDTGAGSGDEVASVTNLAASATGTLVAANSSGISGTITLGASAAALAADTLRIWCKQDLRKRARVKFDGTGTKDSNTLTLAVEMCADVKDQIETALATVRAALTRWATEKGQSGQAFMGRSLSALISDTASGDASGSVSRIRTGFGPELSEAMADNTGGGEQDVVKRVAAASAGVFDGANTGLGAVASHTPLEHCPAATWRFTCVAGADTGNGGSETFNGTAKYADSDEEFSFTGLVVGQAWSGPHGFGPITLTRTHSKTNDASNNVFVAATSATVTGANGANTDNGTLHVKTVDAGGGNWDVYFYSSSNRTAGDLVASVEGVASGATFVASEKEGSGLTVVWQLGGTESALSTITLKLNFFVVQNGDSVPDTFTITTSVTGTPGLIQTTIGEELDFALNSDTLGSETIEDAHMQAGTFPDFAVQDN